MENKLEKLNKLRPTVDFYFVFLSCLFCNFMSLPVRFSSKMNMNSENRVKKKQAPNKQITERAGRMELFVLMPCLKCLYNLN